MQPLESDLDAFRNIKKPSLFFLPHCASSIYHNLLAANWDATALPLMVLIGNSFVRIAENWDQLPARQKQGRPSPEGILRLVECNLVIDVPVKECAFPVRGAFNDLSVMMFTGLPPDSVQLTPLSLTHLLHSDQDA